MSSESRTPNCQPEDHAARSAHDLRTTAAIETAAAMFRALGEPERLRLLARLAVGEACVSELAEAEGEKIGTVSARLKTLHAVRLVRRRREAKHVFYKVADHHVLKLVESAIEHAAEGHHHRTRDPLQQELMP
jgi:ArsR family transcriptional regulator